MPVSRRMRALRRAAVVATVLSAAVGCGDSGGLRAAGETPTAMSPARLWPELTPASSPAYELGEVDTEVVKGVAVPGDDIREVDPVAVVRAEISAHPEEYEGAKAPYRDTAGAMGKCGEGESGRRRPGCPVLKPYYRDLTGDGRADLTLGVRLMPEDLTGVRVYTVHKHRLVQIMAYDDALSGVELAGRSVIIRSPSEVAGYEYRLRWTWDPRQRAMLLTHDEMLPTGRKRTSQQHSPGAGPTSEPAPSRSPSAQSSQSAQLSFVQSSFVQSSFVQSSPAGVS
ncbi:lipoprotein [Streptomyces thermocarboxydovorans]|uniref:Lipoprotein n=1 Tax=Streptomyces thermocarboxydovorans TaxID=59298 RepID=A0ABN1HUJ6_9ACTN